MDKLSLLEKMRTLNRWQTQQQMNFVKLQSDIDSYSDENKNSPASSNKENIDLTGAYGKRSFMQTMGRNALTSALQSIHDANEASTEAPAPPKDGGQDSLQNWHMSGLQTVKFMSHSDTEEDANTYEIEDNVDGTDIEDFSDGELANFDYSEDEGVKPFSETEDEDESRTQDVRESFHGSSVVMKTLNDELVSGNLNVNQWDRYKTSDDESEEDDEKENTVLHLVEDDDHDINLDEKPVMSKLNKPGLTFENIIEEEMKSHMESELNTSSTPMKNKRHKFLKRGEGLKRFEKGMNAHVAKKPNPNPKLKSESSGSTSSSKRSMAFNIKPPSPPPPIVESNQTKPSKTKPGLPLKLNLKRHKAKVATQPKTGERNTIVESTEKSGKSEITQAIDSRLPCTSTSSIYKYLTAATVNTAPVNQQSVSSSILEASFQKMISQYKDREERENKELDDFEALEEAAENLSLSSNSSLVVKLLGKKKKRDEGKQQLDEILEKQPPLEKNAAEEITDEQKQRPPSYDFEDESSWSDNSQSDTSIFSVEESDNTVIHETSLSPPPSPTGMPPMKRIVSKKRAVETNEDSLYVDPDEPDANALPPTSAISLTVQKKLAELENEIKTFRMENDKLESLRRERESEVTKLRKEIQAFQSERKAETERFETYKNEETKKLKAEKRAFDKYQKAAKAFPNKQEREELKDMKEEIDRLKEELKTRETRWNNASHRFRTRITELEGENEELRQEVKIFEEERLDRWKKNEVASSKDEQEKYFPSKFVPITSNVYGEQNKQSPAPRSPQQIPQTSRDLNAHLINSPDSPKQSPGDGGFKYKDGKTEIVLPDHSKLITFPNGTKKTISPDGKVVSVCFFNGDIKRLLPDNRVVYYYAQTQTTHTTYEDGLEVLEFSNQQIEKRHPDGRTEVIFPDQTITYVYPDGHEETVLKDGTVRNVNSDGVLTILCPNGQRETHTRQFKRREYPNGTVKTVYEDGRRETRYSNGRLRLKDKHGNLVMDSGVTEQT